MKLLFDQNISFKIIGKIALLYPEAAQVRLLGLENHSDLEIWEFARINDFTIVSFDADFHELANMKGHPPKIIWLKMGNTTTEHIAQVFIEKYSFISDFILLPENREFSCLEIF